MTRNVLVIEDDRDIARLVELHLRDEGYSVTVVPDGKLGLRQALAKTYDLVILDLILPGLSLFYPSFPVFFGIGGKNGSPGCQPTGHSSPVLSADTSRSISSMLLPTVKSCTLCSRTA